MRIAFVDVLDDDLGVLGEQPLENLFQLGKVCKRQLHQLSQLLVENTGRKEGWALIYSDDGHTAVQRWTQFPLWYKDYGKTWLAYDYPPVHIERKVWEPCEECVSCENCKHSVDYDYGEYKFCNQCVGNSNFIPNNFCQNCGRPLTDEAWAEMEKRLGGCITCLKDSQKIAGEMDAHIFMYSI